MAHTWPALKYYEKNIFGTDFAGGRDSDFHDRQNFNICDQNIVGKGYATALN
jgi:hypothetical protein